MRQKLVGLCVLTIPPTKKKRMTTIIMIIVVTKKWRILSLRLACLDREIIIIIIIIIIIKIIIIIMNPRKRIQKYNLNHTKTRQNR